MDNRNLLSNKQKYISFFFIVLITIVSRLIPHLPNFTPIGGLALFSGSTFGLIGLIIPIMSMVFSDVIIGFHSTIVFVYGSFLLIGLLGLLLKKTSLKNIMIFSLISSIMFFIITNFGVWVSNTMYPKTLNGLLQCYAMAVPFFRNTLFGDLFYSLMFFYGYQFLSNLSIKTLANKKTT